MDKSRLVATFVQPSVLQFSMISLLSGSARYRFDLLISALLTFSSGSASPSVFSIITHITVKRFQSSLVGVKISQKSDFIREVLVVRRDGEFAAIVLSPLKPWGEFVLRLKMSRRRFLISLQALPWTWRVFVL